MKKEVQIFLTAVMFYTRIPVPGWIDHSEHLLNKATKYFPLIGFIVGGFTAALFWGAHLILPASIAILISMIAGILLTGAFHEDGFADFVDAFGGGWTKEKILAIMKDSRIGVYGAIAAFLILLLKFYSLSFLPPILVVKVLLIAHVISRYAATIFIYTSRYVRENDDSKAKPVSKKMNAGEFVLATLVGIAPLFLLPYLYWFFLIAIALCLLWFRRYLHKWIGGYTGDCLGAIQQVAEVLVYLVIVGIYYHYA
jgi:adenosylcobinamide-GDP ribazoletransferase